jgi:hypothetical protein
VSMENIEEFLKKAKLRVSQMRYVQLAHNGSWFDKRGKKLGWGDIAVRDLYNVQQVLENDDIFVVVGEHDSYWSVPLELQDNPGRELLITKGRYFVTRWAIYKMTERWHTATEEVNDSFSIIAKICGIDIAKARELLGKYPEK